jgi:CRP/FNR family transcriptional regulator, cyclic AMP receptor protein
MAKLATENLISALPADLSAGLFSRARPVRLTAGQMLFAAGDMGNGCYRIDAGLLKVSAMWRAAGERILAILGPGSIVGELSEIDEAPRSATVTAIRDSELSFVSRRDFYAFADEHPQLYKHLMVLLARRCATQIAWSRQAVFCHRRGALLAR